MVDIDLIMAKAGSVEKHLRRIRLKTDIDITDFMTNVDIQESILFNIQMGIQNCIDIAAHIISDEGLGVPGSTNEMFYLLEDNGFLSRDLAEKMTKAVGFRNLMVHEYGKIEMNQVFEMAKKDIDDITDYLKSIFHKLGVM